MGKENRGAHRVWLHLDDVTADAVYVGLLWWNDNMPKMDNKARVLDYSHLPAIFVVSFYKWSTSTLI